MGMGSLGLLGMLALSKDERTTVENLKQFVAGFAGSGITSGIGLGDLLKALQGEGEAPDWLVKATQYYSKIRGNPMLMQMAFEQINRILSEQGIDRAGVDSLVLKLGPIVGAEIPEDSTPDDVLVTVLDSINQNVSQADNSYQPKAVIICPKCEYAHLV